MSVSQARTGVQEGGRGDGGDGGGDHWIFLCLIEGWQHQGDYAKRACLVFSVGGKEETKGREMDQAGHGSPRHPSSSS